MYPQCNYFGIYSSYDSGQPSGMSCNSINTPDKLQKIYQHSMQQGNALFHPLQEKPTCAIFKSLPRHHGILTLHQVQLWELHANQEIDFTFEGWNVNLSKQNNYLLKYPVSKIFIRIDQSSNNVLSYIEIIDIHQQSFYYVFTPNFIFNYNSGIICPHQDSKQLLERIKDDLTKIIPQTQSLEFYESVQSFTIDKKKIYLSLRNHFGEFYDYDELLYVAIHELTHAIIPDVGHTPFFKVKMSQLHQKALNLNIMSELKKPPSDYGFL